MENLEEVVRERNRAYFELETGGSGERERVIRQGKYGQNRFITKANYKIVILQKFILFS